jgi:hypothetical protein
MNWRRESVSSSGGGRGGLDVHGTGGGCASAGAAWMLLLRGCGSVGIVCVGKRCKRGVAFSWASDARCSFNNTALKTASMGMFVFVGKHTCNCSRDGRPRETVVLVSKDNRFGTVSDTPSWVPFKPASANDVAQFLSSIVSLIVRLSASITEAQGKTLFFALIIIS